MGHWAMKLMWVFLAAPWLTWVSFHPLADARLVWTLIAHPRESGAAMMQTLRDAYDVPPFSYMFDGVRVVKEARNERHLHPHSYFSGVKGGKNHRTRYWRDAVTSRGVP